MPRRLRSNTYSWCFALGFGVMLQICGVNVLETSIDPLPGGSQRGNVEWQRSTLAQMLLERRAKKPKVVQQMISGWLKPREAGVHSPTPPSDSEVASPRQPAHGGRGQVQDGPVIYPQSAEAEPPESTLQQRRDISIDRLSDVNRENCSAGMDAIDQDRGRHECWEIAFAPTGHGTGNTTLLGAMHVTAYTTGSVPRGRWKRGMTVRLRRPRMVTEEVGRGRRQRNNTIIRLALVGEGAQEEEVGRLPARECR
eukprot:2330375-Rhodomonas_salina.3